MLAGRSAAPAGCGEMAVVYEEMLVGWGRASVMREKGRMGWKMVARVFISVTKGAVESFFSGLSVWASLISKGLVCGGRADVVTLFSMIWMSTSEIQ